MNDNDVQAMMAMQRAILKELDNISYGDEKHISVGEKIAAKVVKFIGSWKFIIMQSILLTFWIALNVAWLANQSRWDPYPFILLNLMLSFQAAYASPLILMAQNLADRKEQRKTISAYRSIHMIEKMMSDMHSKMETYKTKSENEDGNES